MSRWDLTKRSALADFPAALLRAASLSLGAELTGTDAEQSQAHTLPGAPAAAVAILTGHDARGLEGVHDGLAITAPTTPSTQASSAKASLALGGTRLDTTIEAQAGGTAGNAFTFEAKADSPPAGGVTLDEATAAKVLHFEDGVSTVAEAEALIDASATLHVKTASVGGGVLAAPGDALAAAPLLGGTDGITEVRVNQAAGLATVRGFPGVLAAAADAVLHAATNLLLLNQEQIIALVLWLDGATVKLGHVHGAAAALGAAVAPDDAAITAGVGSDYWIRLAHTLVKRTADTVLEQTYDASVTRAFGCTMTPGVHTATHCKFTVSRGYTYRILAWK